MSDKFNVSKIERFSVHDGPGIRTVVFFKGCPLRCVWCHNPETQDTERNFFYTPSLCINCMACAAACDNGAHIFKGNEHSIDRTLCSRCTKCCRVCPTGAIEADSVCLSADEIVDEIKKDVVFYGKNGGITLSGGEPFTNCRKISDLILRIKEEKINVAVETCGFFDGAKSGELARSVDLFLYDIKDTVNERHELYTGVSNERIIKNLIALDAAGAKTVMRCIMVNGVNTGTDNLEGIAKLFGLLKNCARVEIFSYHGLGESKYASLGFEYRGKREWEVPRSVMSSIKRYLTAAGCTCVIR